MISLKNIDPDKLGKLEVGWWIAHNDGDRLKMLKLLMKQHELLFSMPKTKTLLALKTLVSATKDHDVENWSAARKKVEKYYEYVKKDSSLRFNPKKAAQLEVGWWKLHDELEFNMDKSKLADLFSELYSEILNVPKERLKNAGNYKAMATYEHDLAETLGVSKSVAQKHWKNAEKLLVNFYKELKSAVRE